MCRRGDQPVAVGDWGYPGYLTQHEWHVFVSFFKKLSTSARVSIAMPFLTHSTPSLFSAATIQSGGGTPPTRVPSDRI